MAAFEKASANGTSQNVPLSAFVFAVVGFAFIAAKTISLARLFFSLFVFPGAPVSITLQNSLTIGRCSMIVLPADFAAPAPEVWTSVVLRARHRCFRWHWQGICAAIGTEKLQHRLGFSNRI